MSIRLGPREKLDVPKTRGSRSSGKSVAGLYLVFSYQNYLGYASSSRMRLEVPPRPKKPSLSTYIQTSFSPRAAARNISYFLSLSSDNLHQDWFFPNSVIRSSPPYLSPSSSSSHFAFMTPISLTILWHATRSSNAASTCLPTCSALVRRITTS